MSVVLFYLDQVYSQIQMSPVIKHVFSILDPEYIKEVQEKRRKQMNQMLFLRNPQQLLDINHLMHSHFGGITDGKGDVVVEMEVLKAAKNNIAIRNLKKALTVSKVGARFSVRFAKNTTEQGNRSGLDAETKGNMNLQSIASPNTNKVDYQDEKNPHPVSNAVKNPLNSNADFQIGGLNLGEMKEQKHIGKPALSKKNTWMMSSNIQKLKDESKNNLTVEPKQRDSQIRRSVLLPNLVNQVKVETTRKITKNGTILRTPLENYRSPVMDDETRAKESRSVEVTKKVYESRNREIEKMFDLQFRPGGTKLPQKEKHPIPQTSNVVHNYRMEILLKNVGFDIFRSIDTTKYLD